MAVGSEAHLHQAATAARGCRRTWLYPIRVCAGVVQRYLLVDQVGLVGSRRGRVQGGVPVYCLPENRGVHGTCVLQGYACLYELQGHAQLGPNGCGFRQDVLALRGWPCYWPQCELSVAAG